MNIQSNNLILYRKRLIPDECILLKDDVILELTQDYLITQWNSIKPKKDLHHGYSCYLFQEGIKVSKFLREDNSLLYWYCDIVDFTYKKATNELVATDLLIDVIIDEKGTVRVVDLDELGDALSQGLCDCTLVDKALKQANHLLCQIYAGNFSKYTELIDSFPKTKFPEES